MGLPFDDGIYIFLKEVIDNSIDEYVMDMESRIDVTVENRSVTVRDYSIVAYH